VTRVRLAARQIDDGAASAALEKRRQVDD
jgi:hypothetical protein